jgi:hypothetical protein
LLIRSGAVELWRIPRVEPGVVVAERGRIPEPARGSPQNLSASGLGRRERNLSARSPSVLASTVMSDRDRKPGDDRRGVDTSAPRDPSKAATFPPDRWSRAVTSKTHPPDAAPGAALSVAAGRRDAVPGEAPPDELAARKFIATRFAAAGYRLALDYRFVASGVAVRLDAYDPDQRAGFAYISHADADVVNDIGPGEELAFKALGDANTAYVLIVHDRDIASLGALERIVDDFLGALYRRR